MFFLAPLLLLPGIIASPVVSVSVDWPWPNDIPGIEATIPPGPYCPSQEVSPAVQHAIFFDFIDKLYVKLNATDAYLTYVSPDYINHSPYAGQGRDDAIKFLSFFIPTKNRTILHETFDGGIGAVHLKVEGEPPLALVDLFRLNGSCIEEHWDVNQAKPANATNPIALF